MPTITLKGVPQKLHAKLKARARHTGRSLNKEVILTLDQVLNADQPELAGWLSDIRALRERVGTRLTPSQIERFKEKGRR